jgi:hypothetical protein
MRSTLTDRGKHRLFNTAHQRRRSGTAAPISDVLLWHGEDAPGLCDSGESRAVDNAMSTPPSRRYWAFHSSAFLECQRAGLPASAIQQFPVPIDLDLDASLPIIAELACELAAVLLDGRCSPTRGGRGAVERLGGVERLVAHRYFFSNCSILNSAPAHAFARLHAMAIPQPVIHVTCPECHWIKAVLAYETRVARCCLCPHCQALG